MKKKLINFLKDFSLCGLIGWCWECFWTGISSLRDKKDKSMLCRTSLWMFPIYGLAACIRPACGIMKRCSTWVRGTIYTIMIFATEFLTGIALKRHKACPWDYSKAKFNIKGVIRLDYAPAWFALSLLYEKVLNMISFENEK